MDQDEQDGDAFRHVPALRGKLTPAEQSELRVTVQRIEQWDQRARSRGMSADWRRPDAELEATRRALLGEHVNARDLWVYGYGSLMWGAGFPFAAVRPRGLSGCR